MNDNLNITTKVTETISIRVGGAGTVRMWDFSREDAAIIHKALSKYFGTNTD